MSQSEPSDNKARLSQKITIEATCGSEYQRDVAMRVLRKFLDTWKESIESVHKKNKVTITPKA